MTHGDLVAYVIGAAPLQVGQERDVHAARDEGHAPRRCQQGLPLHASEVVVDPDLKEVHEHHYHERQHDGQRVAPKEEQRGPAEEQHVLAPVHDLHLRQRLAAVVMPLTIS